MNDQAGQQDVATLVGPVLAAGGLAPPYHVASLAGGGNNRVYRVESASGTAVVKIYYRSPDDPRDRLAAEFGFSRFAWDRGVRAVPQPLASDPVAGMAAYEFVDGRKLRSGEVTTEHVHQAAEFFRAVNERRADPQSTALPDASEACFSLAGHLDCVDRRITRLRSIDQASPGGCEAVEIADGRMRPLWNRIRRDVLAAGEVVVNEVMSLRDRCISPSDFGFHNALVAAGDHLRFLDFEYAGWDDPAKMVCDFFCQPAVPVPREHLSAFVDRVATLWDQPETVVRRSALLMPVYELKWCCIMLNEFLPAADRRRTFAGMASGQEQRRAVQLAKVRSALDRMEG